MSIQFADFVEHSFVPEHVAHKTPAGRSHFYGILKHILTPARVDRAFHRIGHTSKATPKRMDTWPYLDGTDLQEISPEQIQHLIWVALEHGYSVQTVTHIRNVLRSIFTHAAKTGSFLGKNPAQSVILPAMARKEARCLSLDELRRVIPALRYPEREIALAALLTDMNVAEICGLQWKHVNLSVEWRRLDRARVPPMTIAVRIQSYRAVVMPVLESRQRNVPLPHLLWSVLKELRSREKFTGPDDFVLASRAGTPVNQDNIARRKLKKAGMSLGLPRLSWYVFHRAHLEVGKQLDTQAQEELKRSMPPKTARARHRRVSPGRSSPPIARNKRQRGA